MLKNVNPWRIAKGIQRSGFVRWKSASPQTATMTNCRAA